MILRWNCPCLLLLLASLLSDGAVALKRGGLAVVPVSAASKVPSKSSSASVARHYADMEARSGLAFSEKPKHVEDVQLYFGMPKLMWVIVADVVALGVYLVLVRGATYFAKRRPEDDAALLEGAMNLEDPAKQAAEM
eukprot:TRINITY_DN93850_c0_g1_i1.p1 TRINITY_DN93850_c0_g1~~TRINITY_DN93850_c0_g1_i1.p1  ORF type:complete len:137 (-),score=26.94 TRINITY_DN93850_c0_g1_i1:30-440(-)